MTDTNNAATELKSADQRAISAMRAVLPISVETVVEPAGIGRPDLLVNGTPVDVTWIGDGRLADARRFISETRSRSAVIAAARTLSPGSRSALSDAGISWVDETGAAEIVVGPLIIARTGRGLPKPTRSKKWTPSVLAIAEALLCGVPATVSAIQKATGLSSGSCTNALRTLTDLGLLLAGSGRGPASGRHIGDRSDFLAAYATAASEQPDPIELNVGVIWRDAIDGLTEVGTRWTDVGLDWAATGTVAGAVIAPLLTSVESALVYVDTKSVAGLEAAARNVGLRPIEGGRLTLRPFPTVSSRILRTTRDGLCVAPWPRVYVDLLGTGVRGEEAAEHLREVVDGQ